MNLLLKKKSQSGNKKLSEFEKQGYSKAFFLEKDDLRPQVVKNWLSQKEV